ncbi:MAG: UDP-N-acetylglucosamine diphosphorylase/glucosamine-1-phosphate N-acetyltransferase [Rhizobiales bacterium NRL2]|jgi:bifunctional UDP-N-acetylglucosamine pyrophosphorylase/glucosamine-1-phosphate N-acetyltransferase|nr:MAG: UDP-N-acetylglucosamine diphosphorylase/glucosamine-1-phosphate N-acetyltransferase [Rhizobiales bacterium NRL2]
MTQRAVAAVILAAGMGTRMKSALPKVLHPVAGRPMINRIIDTLAPLRPERTVVVTAPDHDAVRAAVAPAKTAVQQPALGTAHAVLAAREHLEGFDGIVLVMFGDTPLLTAETMRAMAGAMEGPADPAVAVLGFRPEDPAAYGRLVTGGDGALEAIVEFRDCDEAQKRIGFCNAGIMGLDGRVALALLDRIGNDNAKGEYYLTDIVALARAEGRACVTVEGDAEEVMGVDDRLRLAAAERVAQRRLRNDAMANGATLIDPGTVHFCWDTKLGRDVTVEPHVVFGPGVTVGDDVRIKAFSHLEGANVHATAEIGPYARLRPGAEIQAAARIGNFVEVKKAVIEAGAKVNHLSYIGDARVGRQANIGAGTITCNYDGFDKHRTDIGAGAFIGSNSALVAPVRIGDGAIVGAGSTIAEDVAADDLAFTRAPQTAKSGWAAGFRAGRQDRKNKNAK